jgi:hypothetical protein
MGPIPLGYASHLVPRLRDKMGHSCDFVTFESGRETSISISRILRQSGGAESCNESPLAE